jgi:hypothetical protein
MLSKASQAEAAFGILASKARTDGKIQLISLLDIVFNRIFPLRRADLLG